MKSKRPHSTRNNERGAVLIVALIFAGVLAISLASVLRLSINSTNIANRSFYLNAAQNVVDMGMEQALWAINNGDWTGFAARSGFTNQYQGTFPNNTPYYYEFSGKVKGRAKVWIDTNHLEGTVVTPHLVSQGTIYLPDGTTITKSAEAYLKPRSPFDSQMASEDDIQLKGNNPSLNGWDSHSDTTTTADDVRYWDNVSHTGSADDIVKISSMTVISVDNADIYGYASVSPDVSSSIDVKSQGRVGPYGTGNGVKADDYVSYDFIGVFPQADPPFTTSTSGAITGTISLPSGRSAQSTYVDKKGRTVYRYQIPSISLSGNNDVLSIDPGYNVEITVTGNVSASGNNSGITLLNTPDSATPTVLRPSSLKLYVAGDLSLTGKGITNGTLDSNGAPYGMPVDCTIIGTRADDTSLQTFAIKGNGYLSAAVYAPNANITVNGNGDTYGGIVGHSITMNGNGSFHGDVSLARISLDGTWELSKWRELYTPTERSTYVAQLTF